MSKTKSLDQAERIVDKIRRLNELNQAITLGVVAAKLIEQGEPVVEVVTEVKETLGGRKGA